ncbi:DUF6247 family protein [Cryptosporangium sp. NPDC048952]
MNEAVEGLELTDLLAPLRRWQRVAWSSRDERAHRRILSAPITCRPASP